MFDKVLFSKNNQQNIDTSKLKLIKRGEKGGVHPSIPPLRCLVKLFKIIKLLNFFVSEYGLETLKISVANSKFIRFKIA